MAVYHVRANWSPYGYNLTARNYKDAWNKVKAAYPHIKKGIKNVLL